MLKIQILLFFLTCGVCNGLKITALRVPRSASHEAPLDCKYDLEGDKLYDVKWYKDGQQFFRCLPNGEVQEFRVEGVKISHYNYANVGSCPLNLINLNPHSNGEYKCEVTIDGPPFKTTAESSKFKLYEPKINTTTQKDSHKNENQQTKEERSNSIDPEPHLSSNTATQQQKSFIISTLLLITYFIHKLLY